jgi:AcrR family transcriptional regulator
MTPRPRATSDADLLAATARVVSRVGPTLTLADVAKEAGVSAATLVQRFGSKRALLLAFASAAPGTLGEEFARIRAAHRSPLAAVIAVGDCMAAMAESPETLSNSLAFLQMDLVDPDFHTHALAHSRAMRAELTRLLDAAIEAGELDTCDTHALARTVQSLIGGSLVQWAIDRDGNAADRVREDLDIVLRPRNPAARRRRARVRRQKRRR